MISMRVGDMLLRRLTVEQGAEREWIRTKLSTITAKSADEFWEPADRRYDARCPR